MAKFGAGGHTRLMLSILIESVVIINVLLVFISSYLFFNFLLQIASDAYFIEISSDAYFFKISYLIHFFDKKQQK